jgi:hypothetical protein
VYYQRFVVNTIISVISYYVCMLSKYGNYTVRNKLNFGPSYFSDVLSLNKGKTPRLPPCILFRVVVIVKNSTLKRLLLRLFCHMVCKEFVFIYAIYKYWCSTPFCIRCRSCHVLISWRMPQAEQKLITPQEHPN